MKRLSLTLALTAGLFAGAAQAGDYVVVSSAQPEIPEGTSLPGETTITIPAGIEIGALSPNGSFVVLKGPAEGTVDSIATGGDRKKTEERNVERAILGGLFGGREDSTLKAGTVRGVSFSKPASAKKTAQEPVTKAAGTAALPKVSVAFETGVAYLGPQGRSKIDVVAGVLRKRSANSRLMVEGYIAPGEAPGAEGRALAEQRAESVRQYLIAEHNLAPTQVFAIGRGVGGSQGANQRVDIFNIGGAN